jgi:threonine aldolase
VSFCFSKGLGAPVGSMLVGDTDVIERARRARKMFGGGMRQAGVLCAAARVAIDTGVERLAEDHANARALADGIAAAWPQVVDPSTVETNIVMVDTKDRPSAEVAAALETHGVKVGALGPHRIRCVTHRDVNAAGVARAVEAFAAVARG